MIDGRPVWSLAASALGIAQQFALVAILVRRRHHRSMPMFTAYVVGNACVNVLCLIRFTLETFMLLQVITVALRMGIVIEIGRMFGAFPAAATTARRVTLAALVATMAAAVSAITPDNLYTRAHAEAIVRLASGTAWTLTALEALVLWYRIPMSRMARALLKSYPPYLVVFAIIIKWAADTESLATRAWLAWVDPFAFFVLKTYWCVVAWRTTLASGVIEPPSFLPGVFRQIASAEARPLWPRTLVGMGLALPIVFCSMTIKSLLPDPRLSTFDIVVWISFTVWYVATTYYRQMAARDTGGSLIRPPFRAPVSAALSASGT